MQENNNPAPPSGGEPDLLEYLEIVLRRKTLVLMLTAGAAVVSVLVALMLPKEYESTAKILPPQQEQFGMTMMLGQMAGSGNLAGLGGLLGGATPADMYVTVLQSEDIKDAIIDRFRLMEVYGKEQRSAMYQKLEKIVTVKAGKKDGVISITVSDEQPERAAAMVRAYLAELEKLVAEMKVAGASVDRNFLAGRLEKARLDLAQAEESVKRFQSKSKMLDVTEQAKASIEAIAQLKAQLAAQETQLAAVRSRFTDNTPEADDLKAVVASLKRQIAQLEGRGSGSSIIPTGSVPEAGQEYIRVMREFKIQETLVELLTKQYELAKLTEARNFSHIQVIQKPHVPDKKVRPKRILIVLGATFFVFSAAVFWVLWLDFLARLSPEERKSWDRLKAALAWK